MSQCKAHTAKRRRCKNQAKQGEKYCGKHMPETKQGAPLKLQDVDYERITKVCRLGATDEELADFLDIHKDTLYKQKQRDKHFTDAIKKGKELADAEVADRLYSRATGYEAETVKIFQHEGMPVEVPYIAKYPPDTTAAIFWLKNRRPDRWRDKIDHDVLSGGEKITGIQVNIVEGKEDEQQGEDDED